MNCKNLVKLINAKPDVKPGCQNAEPLGADFIQRVRRGEPKAVEKLHALLSWGVRFHLCRQLGPEDLDVRVRNVFLLVERAIQSDDLHRPEEVLRYICKVLHRQVVAHVDHNKEPRRYRIGPSKGIVPCEGDATRRRRPLLRPILGVAIRVLKAVRNRDREMLIRFYLKEQSPGEICRDMVLTEAQFRLIKARAKARFAELARALRWPPYTAASQLAPIAPNIDPHLNEEAWENYSMGDMSIADCARADEHLLICPTCRQCLAVSDILVATLQFASISMRAELPPDIASFRTRPRPFARIHRCRQLGRSSRCGS